MKKLFYFSTIVLLTVLLLTLTSCKGNRNDVTVPTTTTSIIGDWITPENMDFVNIVLSSQHNYIIYMADRQETGYYILNSRKHEIYLQPHADGTQMRSWKYELSGENLIIKAGNLFVNGTPQYIRFPLVASRQ